MATTTPSKQQRSKKQQQQQNQAPMARRVAATLNRLEKKDPGLREFLKKAYGYAVFPAVGKASLVVGGAHGHGGVFERGKFIGHATLSQITLGVQLGGDTFTEILAFHDKGSLDRFKNGHMTFTASASAVLVKAGAAATSNFKGVTAHAYSSGGMLLELAIGGQKFTFKPLGDKQGASSEGGGSGSGKGQSQRGGEDEGAEDGGEDEQGEGGGLGQMLSNARSAVDGVRGAASKVGDLAREHPVAATLIGAGLATGLAFVLVRAVRQAQGASASGEQQGDEQEDDEQDSGARDESDDYEDDERGDDDDREEEDDEHPALTRRGRSRA